MNPRSSGGLLKLPNLPDPTPAVAGEIKRTDPTEVAAAKSGASAKKGFADMTPSEMVVRYLEQGDLDKDGKLSVKDEVPKMDERMQQRLLTADTNHDGFLESRELLTVAAANLQKMKSGKGGGGGGGGRRGGGEGGPPGNGAGPAGGGQ